MSDFPLHLIPLLPLVAAALNLAIGRKLPRDASSLLAVGSVAASLLISVVAFSRMAGGEGAVQPLHETWYTWIATSSFKIDAAFVMDALSGVMTLIVTGVGLLIHIYSIGYMSHERDYARYFGYLNLFMGSMLILVLGDNLVASFVGWEGVGVCSYLLIGFWYDKEYNAYAGRKAFVVNRIGDFGFLLGIFLLLTAVGTVNFGELEGKRTLLSAPLWGKNVAFWGGLLLFVGATGKSAQLPLYVWLPDAMAGPTPVSALIHAATMVTAGVYMVVRLHIFYAFGPSLGLAPHLGGAVMIVGCATAFWAASMAFAQTDIKKVLAYSTISQLGFMFVGAAGAVPSSGIFHLMTHAFFKAGLFLGAGSVMHAMSDRTDILEMGGLRKKVPITHACFLLYTLAIAGCPGFSGFFSKDAILGSAAGVDQVLPAWHHFGLATSLVLLAVAAMTSFYMFRLYFLVFSGESRADKHVAAHIHESPPVMTVPLAVLALLSVVGGLVGTPWHDLLGEFLGAPPEVSIPWQNMLGGTAAFAAGLLGAYLCYAGGVRAPVQRFAKGLPWLYDLVKNKYYVDELYDTIIVRPTKLVAHGFADVFDKFLIDSVLVGGLARLVDGIGYLVRRVQNGDVQRYLATMVIGAAVLIWLAARPPADFAVEVQGTTVTVVAAGTGRGVPRKLRYCWRIDGADKCESERPRDSLRITPGRHKITLRVWDADWGTSASRSLEVHGS